MRSHARLARSGHEVMVLERHDRIGSETSSRSSEVIHAGLYYPPGSLKAGFASAAVPCCYEFARENGVPVQRYGKLLVATREDEIPALEAIAKGGRERRDGP